MRVAVTGAAGYVGRRVVRALAERGHEVRAIDRMPIAGLRDARRLDLADAGGTTAALQGCDAVVHLAAVPGPRTPGWEAFDPNVTTTYHVLEAARCQRVARIVLASSIWAYGYNPPDEARLPASAPLREGDAVATFDSYALSKRLMEALGREYASVAHAQVVCLRFPAVLDFEAQPKVGAGGAAGSLSMRAELWSYVEVRDAAAACCLAVEADHGGFRVLNAGAADTRSALPSGELLRRYLPACGLARPVAGCEALYDITAAAEFLGFAPERSWRTA